MVKYWYSQIPCWRQADLWSYPTKPCSPKDIHIASVIASRQAIDYVKDHFPENTTIWVGAIDDKLDEHSYIVPGLGDAGDLAYGIKE